MREPSNRKKVMLTLILSAEDNDVLTEAAKEVGLKKSEYLRAIIQGIGAGSKIARQIEMGDNANIEVEGYGFNIPHNVMEELLHDISKKLIVESTDSKRFIPFPAIRVRTTRSGESSGLAATLHENFANFNINKSRKKGKSKKGD